MSRAAATLVVLAAACSKPSAKAVELIVGDAGTLIVNSVRPTPIPLRVADENGQLLSSSGVKFKWESGDKVAIADSGTVTCTHSGDAFVSVSLGKLDTKALIRCRPVRSVRIPGPMNFQVGDTARAIPVEALDFAGKPVSLLSGSADIRDTLVAVLDGSRVRPVNPGTTVVKVRVGDETADVGVSVRGRGR